MSAPLPVTLNPLQARLALRRHLLSPDGSVLVSDEGEPGSPVSLALSLATAILGGVVFAVTSLLPLEGLAGALSGLGVVLSAVMLAGLLTLPPLYLVSALGRRSTTLHHVAAGASVGPVVCGAWLAAGTPMLLLYAPTGADGVVFPLLVAALLALAFLQGGVAAVRRARRAGARSPGVLAIVAHYSLLSWTVMVLASTL